MTGRMSFDELYDFYRHHLMDDVLPFWLDHAIDRECGGINTCIEDDGTILSYDKYMWSQWRAVWVFASLVNRFESRPEWRDAAESIYRFAANHGFDGDGRTVFSLDRTGRVKEPHTSIYADGFALYGLTAYYEMTQDDEARQTAMKLTPLVQHDLARPGSYPTEPLTIPAGYRAHGPNMIFSLVFYELGLALNDRKLQAAGLALSRDIFEHFVRPEDGLLHEMIRGDLSIDDAPPCRVIVPGHVIESMWFQIHIWQRESNSELIDQACRLIRRHIELGWDDEYGGIFHAVDPTGSTEGVAWRFPDAKVWWPATESLYALLLAHEITSESWCLDWYWKVHEDAFRKYPHHEHGEWRQRLDRQGRPIKDTVALPVKDPFHLPRALLLILDVLDRLRRS